jgi:peptidoglycan biosynthesis protein MviN/MurJ (putative lipid II flippase)
LGRFWGVGGIPLAVTIAIIPKTIYLMRALSARFGKRSLWAAFTEYVKECLLPASAASLVALAASAWLARILGTSTWLTAGACGALFCAIYAVVSYAVCFKPDERLRMRRYVAVLVPQAS